MRIIEFNEIPYKIPAINWKNFELIKNSSFISILNKKGNATKPNGNIKKGGNNNDVNMPQITNWIKIFKSNTFFYF